MSTVKVNRHDYLAEKIIIVDGQAGCGKTLFSPIIAALDRVELLTYAYEIEHICSLRLLGKIDADAAMTMVKMLTDLQLYNTMMGRETNFRLKDLSSVFRDAHPWRYFKRIWGVGDEYVPARIKSERPILHLTTHNMLDMGQPVFDALGKRLVFLDIVRHPLYRVKQLCFNMDHLVASARNFTMHLEYEGHLLPYFTRGWEDLFIKSNSIDKAIYKMYHLTKARVKAKPLAESAGAQVITIPFERFVIEPWSFMDKITVGLGTQMTSSTRRMMRLQKVPRAKISDGIPLAIYKRCGWTPPQAGASEAEELEARRTWAVEKGASADALSLLDEISKEYVDEHHIF